jgi:hypothetical protein
MTNNLEHELLEEWIEVMRQTVTELAALIEYCPISFGISTDPRKRDTLSRIKKAIDEVWECIEILNENMSEVERDD